MGFDVYKDHVINPGKVWGQEEGVREQRGQRGYTATRYEVASTSNATPSIARLTHISQD